MFKRVINSKLPAICLSFCFDEKYFIAIDDAGLLPVLDCEFLDSDEITETITKLSNANHLFGLRLNFKEKEVINFLKEKNIRNLDAIIFYYDSLEDIERFDDANVKNPYFIETIDIEIEKKLGKISPNALIIKGSEAGGRVAGLSSFVLMQTYLEKTKLPIFVQGGVGIHTTAGIFASGASGIVLDSQFFLADEAPLSSNFKKLIENLEDNNTTVLGQNLGYNYRFFSKPGTKITKELKLKELEMIDNSDAKNVFYEVIKSNIKKLNDNSTEPLQSLFYLGQDAVFAKHFVKKSKKLKDIVNYLFSETHEKLALIDDFDPLQENSTLAKEHKTKYPLIQGPMANISDNANFALSVFENGALPFFALGNLPSDLADKIIIEGKNEEKLKSFGAGMIGIEALNPTLESHIKIIKKHKVPFALFAAGSPANVKKLEELGTKTYLHTPTPSFLKNAVKNECTNFIFEGKEAGGHIGALSSFTLWELAIETILENQITPNRSTLIFAGGISTKSASFFISGMSAFLYEKGFKIGIQVGTAYLATKEILESLAIKSVYQKVVLENKETSLIGSSVGLPSRVIKTPFTQNILKRENDRIRNNIDLGKRKKEFEQDNIGALLIASKGFQPIFENNVFKELKQFNEKEQFEKGNFMAGDSVVFSDYTMPIKELHQNYFDNKESLHKNLNSLEALTNEKNIINDEIAIVGIGCIYPDAKDKEAFWNNIVNKKYSIIDINNDNSERFYNFHLFYDEDKKKEDKTYTSLAGVIKDNVFTFDEKKYGYEENKGKNLSRSQQLVLEAALQAALDANILEKDTKLKRKLRKNTSVIVASCLGNETNNNLHFKYSYPEILYYLDQIDEFQSLSDEKKKELKNYLKEKFSDGSKYEAVHTVALNIEASRIAHHLGAEGINYTVDAACATSFAALDCGIKELLSGKSDLAIIGGVNSHLAPEPFVGFCKLGALSNIGSYPFDKRASGFVMGEGAGVVILKRAKDAIRDKDKIYALIKALGASSDGKGKAIAAPNQNGQVLALKRCIKNLRDDFDLNNIDFIEAHGTSTIMGDITEIEALKAVYNQSNNKIGISSIKSQIGHLLGGAGMAGLIKAILAIKNKTLPPNGLFEELSRSHNLQDSPFYIIEEAKEWNKNTPLASAISSYGFGGINYHAIIEEFTDAYKKTRRQIFNDLSYDFNEDRIVAVGMGTLLPNVKNSSDFWEKLKSGETSISDTMPSSKFHNDYYAKEDKLSGYHIPNIKAGIIDDYKFNNTKYKIPPFTAKFIDKAQKFALDATSEAISQAKMEDFFGYGNNIGVIFGTISGTHQSENILRVRLPLIEKFIKEFDAENKNIIADKLLTNLKKRFSPTTEDTTTGLLSNLVSGRVANFFNCNGKNFVIDASCASSSFAFETAMENLKTKQLDFAITGGVDANLYPAVIIAFKRLSLLSTHDNYFFDKRAEGYVMGEGAAVQILTTYKKACENNLDIIGEIKGISFSSSAPKHLLSPSEEAYSKAIETCYEKINIKKNEIKYIDVFGVSNPLFDLVEKQAIETSFPNDIFFGNTKSQFAYFKAANPAVVLNKLLLMTKNKAILPNFAYSKENSIVEKNSILKANPNLKKIEDNFYLASNVNGIGGNHGHMVLGSVPAFLSKKNEQKDNQEEEIFSPILQKTIDFDKTKKAVSTEPYSAKNQNHTKSNIIILLSGQGAQSAYMMQELYKEYPLIRTTMDKGEEIFKKSRGYSLLDLMFSDNNEINLTENTQPSIFLSSASIYEYLRQTKNIMPNYFVGHSIGEYTALFCNGILDFESSMSLVLKRADLMKECTSKTQGKIMVLFVDERQSEKLIRQSSIEVFIANKNSKKQTAISGTKENIDKFCNFLKSIKKPFIKLKLSGAFHSNLFDDAAFKMKQHLDDYIFSNTANYSKIISNVTGKPYPNDIKKVKELLSKQIASPVEFIKSIEYVYEAQKSLFLEIGPNKLLGTLLKDINIAYYDSIPAVDVKVGQLKSFDNFLNYIDKIHKTPFEEKKETLSFDKDEKYIKSHAFEDFKKQNQEVLDKVLYKEFIQHKKEDALASMEKYNFYDGKIVISGVSIGLPGKARKVFSSDNFEKILNGTNFIEPISEDDKKKITEKKINRLFKQADGNARFVEIENQEDVIQLAGQLGFFDLNDEYGVEFKYDSAMALAVAAGIEALKDANIPLVMNYKQTSLGKQIPEGFALPKEMQGKTGVIVSSAFPNNETVMVEMNRFYYHKFYVEPYEEFENIYYHLMESVKDSNIKKQITNWFFKVKERNKEYPSYQFDRNFAANMCPLGSAHLARFIKAQGPNILLNGACASTTQAIGVANDWIRCGRCERVIIIGGDNVTSSIQNQWVGSAFLSLGAATIKKEVEEAAKPFDAERNGTILGAGAVGLVIEKEECLRKRGLNGQAEILGSYLGNSGFHTFNIDVNHLAVQMEKFVKRVEKNHNLNKDYYTKKLIFMSHETYTPKRGGSADAEINALRKAFPNHYPQIAIANTKGYTGHTLGAGIEDAVLVKALQKGQIPPIANLSNIEDNFKDLCLNKKLYDDFEYGIHTAAGFGSHFAFLMLKKLENGTIQNNDVYYKWLQNISGSQGPVLTITNNALCVEAHGSKISEEDYDEKTNAQKETKQENKIATTSENSGNQIETIKQIIAKQTGYETDMLEDDLDMEADLGIDSIKQVEIFGEIAEKFNFKVPEDLKLVELNTIKKLTNFILNETSEKQEKIANTQQKEDERAQTDTQKDVKRFLIKPVTKKLEGKTKTLKNKTLLVSFDNYGFADEFAKKTDANIIEIGKNNFELFENKNNIQEELQKIKNSNIDGFIHFAPINYYFEKTQNPIKLSKAIKSFFLIVKTLQNSINKEDGIIASCAFNSVVIPYIEKNIDINPVFAGISGMLKSINKEFKNTSCKMVDFANSSNVEKTINLFINEIQTETNELEVAYKDGQRFVLKLEESKIQENTNIIKQNDTILVTGGGSGITFEILKNIGKEYKTKFIILGRSNIEEKKELQNIADDKLISFVMQENPNMKPVEASRQAAKIKRAREVKKNIEELRSLNIDTLYKPVSVIDAKQLDELASDIKNIDGIIHAAGVEESNFIEKKELDSFSKVFDTKILGAFNLLKSFANYRFFIAFSSVTAKFGNEGQTDYTSANDMLGKIVQREASLNPSKQYKIYDWTAWNKIGMATKSSVEYVLKEKKISFLEPKDGIKFFLDDLLDDNIEAVFTGIDYEFDINRLLAQEKLMPFLDKISFTDENKAKFKRKLSLFYDLFLKDHSKDDIPIFLGATGIEAMAEAAFYLLNSKNKKLVAVSDFSIPYGIKILKGKDKEIEIEAVLNNNLCKCKITSFFQKKKISNETLHYEGSFYFDNNELPSKKIALPKFNKLQINDNLASLIYHPKRLFMEGLFKTIEEISHYDGKLLISKIMDKLDKEFFKNEKEPKFLSNVVIVDAMFQTGGIFEFLKTDMLVLPLKIANMKFYSYPKKNEEYFCITEKMSDNENTNTYKLILTDKSGNIFIEIDNFEMIKISKIDKKYSIKL